ncbi:BA14K family protein [Mesorhizobium caraganae]|uniref:Lectin-like protein BA14k n=1 Tax=Mesorhizobium caraganae TaxID=483206 RepID=A0ABV1Z0S3_9HYPH
MLTLAVFTSGLAFATWLLAAKPVRQATPSTSVADLWTRDARPVNAEAQSFERIPAEQDEVPRASGMAKAAPDPIVTSAIQPSTGEVEAPAELPAAHVEWCVSRYRSYQPENNSYRSYTGRQRPCISPYSGVATAQAPDAVSYVEANYASMDGYASTDEVRPQLSPEHIDYCLSRYRSYRPEDNTYQPYSGGPRRQCQ